MQQLEVPFAVHLPVQEVTFYRCYHETCAIVLSYIWTPAAVMLLAATTATINALLTALLAGCMQIINHTWVSEGASEGPGTTFFLDGAHTPESMATCAEWFAEASQLQQESADDSQSQSPPQRILLFNCMKVNLAVVFLSAVHL